MIKRSFTLEKALWLGALITTIFMRIVLLSQPTLNDSEASLALQAVQLANGQQSILLDNPLYVLVTGALFRFFGSTTFLARFLPMITGIGLLGVVYLLRDRLGRETALIAVWLLAIAPGFLSASRQVDSPIMGMFFFLLLYALLENKKAILAGFVFGLGLLTGISFWQGIIYSAIVIGVWKILLWKDGDEPWKWLKQNAIVFWQAKGWIGFLGGVLVAGTMIFWVPTATGDIFSGIVDYFAGWGNGYHNSLLQFLVLLPVYELVPMILGLVYGIIATVKQNRTAQFLILFWFVAVILTLSYPDRKILDMIWVVLPLIILAAMGLFDLLSIVREAWLPTMGLGAAIALLVTFAIYSGLLIVTLGAGGRELEARIVSLIGALIIAGVLVGMMVWAWSGMIGFSGLTIGLLIVGSFFTVSQAWKTAGLGAHPEMELWRNSSRVNDADLLVKTLESIGSWNNGVKNETPIAVVNFSSPSMQWELRNFAFIKQYSAFPVGQNPEIVITPIGEQPASTDSYTGQDFVWQKDAEWDSLTNQEWMNWFLRRQVTQTKQTIILWARTDILPAGKAASGGTK
jgi:4-amino-4-deoxy-L-arabinose transferase-like glycosyltransferase